MKTCKDLNIDLCHWCLSPDFYNPCIINDWYNWFNKTNDIEIIKNLLQRKNFSIEYYYYGEEALKFF
jgi:hypothetical protein